MDGLARKNGFCANKDVWFGLNICRRLHVFGGRGEQHHEKIGIKLLVFGIGKCKEGVRVEMSWYLYP